MDGWVSGWVDKYLADTRMDVRVGKITLAVVGTTEWGQEDWKQGVVRMVRELLK